MVLVQRHSHAHAGGLSEAVARIEPVRVAGIAGAIALNAAALMLLLVPVSAPMQEAKEDEPILILDDRRIEPPKPPPPIEVPVVRPQTRTPAPVVQPQPQPPQPVANDEVIVPDGSEYVPPVDTAEIAPPTIEPATDPLPSTRLEYASAPAPAYPREAILDGIEGTVVLKVLVDVNGKPLSVEVERSSGHRRLDEAARRQVLRKWMFKPAVRNGQAVQVYGLVPVNFTLGRQ